MKRRLKLLFAAQTERYVARLFRDHPNLKLVAVGGSVGKTSTKLAIAAVLSQKYRVQHHEGNYNDLISVPLAILGLPVPALYNPLAWFKTWRRAGRVAKSDYPYDVVLVELGTDQPGDMPAFMKHLRPDIGVLTATTPEHMEMFKTEAAVIAEELALAYGSQVAIINSDDEGLKAHRTKLGQRVVTFGSAGEVHFEGHDRTSRGTWDTTLYFGNQFITKVATKVIAHHSFYALAAAAAVGRELGLSAEQIAHGLAAFRPVPGRMNPLIGLNDSLIIDDSYNASPDAVVAALQALGSIGAGRKIAVLGSMNELGEYSKEGHERVGSACGKLDLLVTVGSDAANYLVPAAQAAGLKAGQIKSFQTPYQAGNYLKSLIKSGDTVLIKGSQNRVFTEEAAALLLADPADRSKLVRQTPNWLKIKHEQFPDG